LAPCPAFSYSVINEKLACLLGTACLDPSLPTKSHARIRLPARRQQVKTRLLRIAAIACLLAVATGILVVAMSDDTIGKRDFVEYWAAGQQLVHGANPYDGEAILRLERGAGFVEDHPLITFSPPIAFVWALPLGFFAARTGAILWLLAIMLCLMASIRILWGMQGRPPGQLHLLGYLFAPVLGCLMAGQLGIFLLLGVVLFLRFHQSRPLLAGAALLPWALSRKAYRILAGIAAVMLAACALVFCFDPHAWQQYAQMMSHAQPTDLFVPTLSMVFRLLVDSRLVWLQFVPEAAACVWALWYLWTRRSHWNWMDQGLLLLLVSELCAPYAWFTDEAMVLPAVLAAAYRADKSGRSLIPFGLLAGAALIELLAGVKMTTPFYLWTAPAWLAWYLYAVAAKRVSHLKRGERA
jgi:hypothetical protein